MPRGGKTIARDEPSEVNICWAGHQARRCRSERSCARRASWTGHAIAPGQHRDGSGLVAIVALQNKAMNQTKAAQDCRASRDRFIKAAFAGYGWCSTDRNGPPTAESIRREVPCSGHDREVRTSGRTQRSTAMAHRGPKNRRSRWPLARLWTTPVLGQRVHRRRTRGERAMRVAAPRIRTTIPSGPAPPHTTAAVLASCRVVAGAIITGLAADRTGGCRTKA